MRSSIATLILTYNEEENLRDCIESVKWSDEIVVIDSYSEDNSVQIALEYTEKVYKRKFDDFASQRNFGLEKIESEWVLVVDADERVTSNLKEEILEKLNNSCVQGYKIPRKNYFLGKWIKYCGWYPDYTMRLFKVAGNRYTGLVHEGLDIEKFVKLNNPFIHYTYRDIEHYVNKLNHYSTLDAEKKYSAGKRRSILYIIIRPIFEFIKLFILERGFLLGNEGLILSILMSYYQFLKSAKLWEKYNIKDSDR